MGNSWGRSPALSRRRRQRHALAARALAEHAGIAEQACFVGRGGTFQIWSPDRLRAYQEEAHERRRRNRTTIPPLIPGPGEKR